MLPGTLRVLLSVNHVHRAAKLTRKAFQQVQDKALLCELMQGFPCVHHRLTELFWQLFLFTVF